MNPKAARYLVELEPGVWLAPWSGDPGRTLIRDAAIAAGNRAEAARWLARARTFRPFLDAVIVLR